MEEDSVEEWLGKALKDAHSSEEWMLDGLISAVMLLEDRTKVFELISGFLGESSTNESIVNELYRRKRGQVAVEDTHAPSISTTPSVSTDRVRHVERGGDDHPDACVAVIGKRVSALHVNGLVVNCLSCGKIFDLRRQEVFFRKEDQLSVNSGGTCIFCGAHVYSLSSFFSEENTFGAGTSVLTRGSLPATKCFTREARFHHSENTFTSSLAEVKDQNVHVCDVPIPDAVTIAWESKDRLVDFDRAAASRTVIIDDQSDWFEIDGNAWLDKSERDEMKKQAQDVLVAQEERQTRHTGIDLLGRKVGDTSFGSLIHEGVGSMLVKCESLSSPQRKPSKARVTLQSENGGHQSEACPDPGAFMSPIFSRAQVESASPGAVKSSRR